MVILTYTRVFYHYVIISAIVLCVTACGDRAKKEIDRIVPLVVAQLEQLNQALVANQIDNAQLLKIYNSIVVNKDLSTLSIPQEASDIIFDPSLTASTKKALLASHLKPNIAFALSEINLHKLDTLSVSDSRLNTLMQQLVKEAYPNSPSILTLQERLKLVQNTPRQIGTDEDVIEELYALVTATQIVTYNNSLIDMLNVFSDISGHALPSINQETQTTPSEHQQAGRHLVGNPNYGTWQHQGGQSVWTWFAAYAMFSMLMPRPYYYHSWYHRRPYSYYNDYGRGAYASQKETRSSRQVHQRNQSRIKHYGAANNLRRSRPLAQPIQRRASTYSRSQRLGTRSRSRFGGK